jgi:hypothetical protein
LYGYPAAAVLGKDSMYNYPTAAGVGKVFKKSSTKPVEQVGNK